MTPEALNGSQEPVTLEAVKSRFDHWRATRQKRGKTPEALWEDVSLCPGYIPLGGDASEMMIILKATNVLV